MQSVDTKEQVGSVVRNSYDGPYQNAAGNKVDRTKIDQGDLVNALRQALDKRLGTEQDVVLTGAENLLRTQQVRADQRGTPTFLVYT